MIQDLRQVNDMTQQEDVKVSNPHTLLNNIGPQEKYFSVIDLSNAFFSIPVHPASQGLFAFKYGGKTYTYTRLPQGFTNSPTIYSQALEASMQKCDPLIKGQYLLYVDDILVTGHDEKTCKQNTITVLK